MGYSKAFRQRINSRKELYDILINRFNGPDFKDDMHRTREAYTNDFISNIYVSERFVKEHPIESIDTVKSFSTKEYETYSNILNDGSLNYNNCNNPIEAIYYMHPDNSTQKHTIPARVLINPDTIERYTKDEEYFNKAIDSACIVFVTKEEDAMLRKAGLMSSMPKNIDFTDKPFARYDKTLSGIEKNIEIYGHKIVDGRLVKK